MHVSILLLLIVTCLLSTAFGWVTFHEENRHDHSDPGHNEGPGHRHRRFNGNPRFFKSENVNGGGHAARAGICSVVSFPWCEDIDTMSAPELHSAKPHLFSNSEPHFFSNSDSASNFVTADKPMPREFFTSDSFGSFFSAQTPDADAN